MPGFTLIRVSSQQSSRSRGEQALTERKNESPVQSWLSSLTADATLEVLDSMSMAVDLPLLEPTGTLALYFQHPGQYLLLAMWQGASAKLNSSWARTKCFYLFLFPLGQKLPAVIVGWDLIWSIWKPWMGLKLLFGYWFLLWYSEAVVTDTLVSSPWPWKLSSQKEMEGWSHFPESKYTRCCNTHDKIRAGEVYFWIYFTEIVGVLTPFNFLIVAPEVCGGLG